MILRVLNKFVKRHSINLFKKPSISERLYATKVFIITLFSPFNNVAKSEHPFSQVKEMKPSETIIIIIIVLSGLYKSFF